MRSESWSRSPAVAGRFYPSDPVELKSAVDECLGIQRTPQQTAHAVLVPHAGYVYSGAIAGMAYARVAAPKTAVILCPNHTGRGQAISIWSQGNWRTPLGDVAVDEGFASELCNALGIAGDREAHLVEHAVEVQVPFLQRLNPKVRIVPIVLGRLTVGECEELGRVLAKISGTHPRGDVLWVASSDMSHYIPADDAERLDSLALEAVRVVDPRELYRRVSQHDISMCGFIPTTVVLAAARASGVELAELVAYGNSGDVTGDRSSVVGYASAVFR